MKNIRIISIRENPHYMDQAILYIQKIWATKNSLLVYDDCIKNGLSSDNSLPQWYLMLDDEKIIGCAGLITNDFISRMDLYPWICAIFVEKDYRGHALGEQLLIKASEDAKRFGYKNIYLCTDHIGYYEKYNFTYIGIGFHPWGESSRIYKHALM